MRMTSFAVAGVIALMTAPAFAATVVNGSFEEDPGVAGIRGNNFSDMSSASQGGSSWDIWTDLPGWTTTSGKGIEIQTNATLGVIDAQDGNYYVELDSANNSSMAQSVFLDIGAYELSFYYSPRTANENTNGIDFGIESLFSGSVTGPNDDIARGVWTEISTIFNVDVAGDYDLFFAATGTSNRLGGLIDNVSISAVPLPASSLLLLGGLGAMGALRRRNRS